MGKSSLLNALVGRRGLARISGTPGRTQQVCFYSLNEELLLVDLPGYGYVAAPVRVRSELAGIIETYLTSRRPLALAVLLLDSRHEPSELDRTINGWLAERGLPVQVVCTKADKVPGSRRRGSLERVRRILGREDIVHVSSVTGEGKRELWQAIDRQIAHLRGRRAATPPDRPPR